MCFIISNEKPNQTIFYEILSINLELFESVLKNCRPVSEKSILRSTLRHSQVAGGELELKH